MTRALPYTAKYNSSHRNWTVQIFDTISNRQNPWGDVALALGSVRWPADMFLELYRSKQNGFAIIWEHKSHFMNDVIWEHKVTFPK
jgi:hypothetical protein